MANNADLGFLDRLVFLAIDAGSEWAGYCIGRGGLLLDSGTEDIANYTRRAERDPSSVWARVACFGAFATSLAYNCRPDFIIMELPMGDHNNRHTDRVMGALLGSLIEVARVADAKRVQCTPQEVKRTGYHKGAKRDAALLAGVPLELMSADRADALGLWQAGVLKVRDVVLAHGETSFNAIDVVNGETLYVVN